MRLRGETAAAKQGFLDYLAMGPGRSLRKLYEEYRDPKKYKQDMNSSEAPPTRQLSTIQMWSSAYNWVKRVNRVTDEQIDTIFREQKRALAEASLEQFASPAARIKALNQIAEMLLEYLIDVGLIKTVIKQVGSGKNTRMKEEKSVDTQAIQAFRGVLEDLAKETGGRPTVGKMKHEVEGEVTARNIFVLPDVAPLPIPYTDEIIEGEFTSGNGRNSN